MIHVLKSDIFTAAWKNGKYSEFSKFFFEKILEHISYQKKGALILITMDFQIFIKKHEENKLGSYIKTRFLNIFVFERRFLKKES